MKSKIQWWTEEDGTWVYLHEKTDADNLEKVHVEIKRLAASHPTKGKAVFGTNADSNDQDYVDLLINDGYKIVWHKVHMELPIEEILPSLLHDSFEIRPVIANHHRMIYDANKSVYAGQWGATPSTDEDFQEFMEESADTTLWSVAWSGDEIAGFVLSSIDGESSDLNQVSVLPKFRRKGLAQTLLAHNTNELKKRGVKRVRLHTDAKGSMGGRQLYEKVGFKPVKENFRMRKPLR